MEGAVAVKAPRLEEFCVELLCAVGADRDEACELSRVLVWCDLIGRNNHGVWRLPTYLKQMRSGALKSPSAPTFSGNDGAVQTLDGDHGSGYLVGKLGMERAIELAKEHGVGVVAVRHSNFFGIGAYYVQLAAAQGMIGLAMSNSTPKVAPPGGTQRVLGTNPFAFGAPRKNGKNILVDMSTGASAGSTIKRFQERGEKIPEGLMIRADGSPLTDPAEADEGAMLPFGGAKGFGLSLMVEILCGVVSGAAFSHQLGSMFRDLDKSGGNGHLFLALEIKRFMDLDQYFSRMEELITFLRDSAGPDSDGVLLPGEVRWKNLERNQIQGVPIDSDTQRELEAAAASHGISVPWKEAA